MGQSLTCAAGCLQRWRVPASRDAAGEGSGSNAVETKSSQVAENVALKMSPKSGPEMVTFVYTYTSSGARFPGIFLDRFSSLLTFVDRWNLVSMQAFGIWRWHNFPESEGVGDKAVVPIDMGESCCQLSPQLQRGLVAFPPG